jgi:hypothetical protein
LTLFTAQWKSGKTTLLSVLLSRLKPGGYLLGHATRPARALVLSEEDISFWGHRQSRLSFGPDIGVICRPFNRKPSYTQWRDLIAHVATLLGPDGARLLVVDSIGTLFPRSAEVNADCMNRSLEPLRRLATQGVAVLLLHHPSKGGPAEGQAARGTGALPAEVEIVLEWRPLPDRTSHDYIRILSAFSRHSETPRRLILEWLPDQHDYRLLTEPPDDDFARAWATLSLAFSGVDTPLTRADILDRWPPGSPPPSAATLSRWLARAVELGLLHYSGAGHRFDPYVYRLKS